jgi:flagellar protein FliO/FliZ
MKWILFVAFLSLNLLAESNLKDLPTDVQNEINSTEAIGAVNVAAATVKPMDSKTQDEKSQQIGESKAIAPEVNKATAKEDEIPLSLEATKKAGAGETTYFRIIMVVALLGILACGTFIFVRRAKTQNIKRNKNEIKILAQHYLGPKKSLAVVRVAGESILVGITDAHINMIKTLSLMDDELPEVTSQNFQSELDERMNEDVVHTTQHQSAQSKQKSATYNRKSQINTRANNPQEEEMDEFSIKGIKDLVSSKLKNMRSI